jgi:hypothetical protein
LLLQGNSQKTQERRLIFAGDLQYAHNDAQTGNG